MLYRTSIIVKNRTRDILKTLGRKDQTFDDIINELIIGKKKDGLNSDQSNGS